MSVLSLRASFRWSTAGQVAQAASALARAMLLARLLAPDDLGRLFLLLSVAGVAAGIGVGAVSIMSLRRVAAAASASESATRIRDSCRHAAAAHAVLAVAIAAGLAVFGESWATIAAIVAFLTVQSAATLIVALAKGMGRLAAALAYEGVVASLAQVMVLGVCVFAGLPLPVPVLLVLLSFSYALPIIGLAPSVVHAARDRDRDVSVAPTAGSFSEFATIAANALAWQALVNLPLWIAGALGNVPAAAVYGIAQRVAGGLRYPLTAVAAVIAPVAARALPRREFALLEQRLRRGALAATGVVMLGFVILLVSGRGLFGAAFGPFFESAWPVALVLGLAELVNSATGMGGSILLMMNESSRLVRLSMISALVLTLLGWPLCLVSGAMGLAWATFAAWGLQNLMVVMAVRRLTGMRMYLGFA